MNVSAVRGGGSYLVTRRQLNRMRIPPPACIPPTLTSAWDGRFDFRARVTQVAANTVTRLQVVDQIDLSVRSDAVFDSLVVLIVSTWGEVTSKSPTRS